MVATILPLASALVACAVAGVVNDRPIVGILTQPLNIELEGSAAHPSATDNRSYIAASYVKFAESAGARVVPLHFDAPEAELRSLFSKINGVIFPGGGASLKNSSANKFRQAAQFLYDLALESNDRGDPFPIHGTCLGFQLLTLLAAQNDSVICHGCFKTEGTPLPLDLTAAANSSKLFAEMSPSLLSAVTRENLTENSHVNGIVPEQYDENVRLHEFYTVLSTNKLSNGMRFVSTIEAKKYPFSATQWHPEKNNFEWGAIGKLGLRAIPHSAHAVALSQYMANDFVARARLSSKRFVPGGSEAASLIYNHAPVEDPQGYFSQIYLWGEVSRAQTANRLVVV